MKVLYKVIVFYKDEVLKYWVAPKTVALKELNDFLSNPDMNKDIQIRMQLAQQ